MSQTFYLVGGGLTSALLAKSLRQKLGDAAKIVVFEKSRGLGGRTISKRLNSDGSLRADFGAQIITENKNNSKMVGYIKEWQSKSWIKPFNDKMIAGPNMYNNGDNYVITDGFGSLAKNIFKDAGTVTNVGVYVKRIDENGVLYDDQDNAISTSDGFVVLTMPIPQFIGDSKYPFNYPMSTLSPDITKNLENVKYSVRHALVMHWEDKKWLAKDLQEMGSDDWVMKYYDGKADEGAVRYACWDDRKRTGASEGSVFVVHSATPFSLRPENFNDMQAAGKKMEDSVLTKFKEFEGTGYSATPHFWKYSQVHKPYNGTPGFLQLQEKVWLTGDAFSDGVGVDSCIQSAEATSDSILMQLQPQCKQ